MTKDKKDREASQELAAEADQAEAKLRQMRCEVVTPAEVEFVWEHSIKPHIPFFIGVDEDEFKVFVKQAIQNYIDERERRHELGLPPLYAGDIDAPRKGPLDG